LRFREKWRIALSHVRRVVKAGFTITAVVAHADYGSTAAFRRDTNSWACATASPFAGV
jgi:SRSO17 transposase